MSPIPNKRGMCADSTFLVPRVPDQRRPRAARRTRTRSLQEWTSRMARDLCVTYDTRRRTLRYQLICLKGFMLVLRVMCATLSLVLNSCAKHASKRRVANSLSGSPELKQRVAIRNKLHNLLIKRINNR
jgi:hypothetical protein